MASWTPKPQVSSPRLGRALLFLSNCLYACFSAPTSFYSGQRPAANPFCGSCSAGSGCQAKGPQVMPGRTRGLRGPTLLSPPSASLHLELTLGPQAETSGQIPLSPLCIWFRLMAPPHAHTDTLNSMCANGQGHLHPHGPFTKCTYTDGTPKCG